MDFKLNIVITLEAASEQNARHRRETILTSIRKCPGVSGIVETWFTTNMPDLDEVGK